jgi:alpha-glucosidase
MFDSHDIPRLYNNPDISFESYRAAVIMLFTFPGSPSVYYGDEAGLDGHVNTVEGCRYPMQWDGKQTADRIFKSLPNSCPFKKK